MDVGLRSRKHIQPFRLVRPHNIVEAREALRGPGTARIMAGGIDLIDEMKFGITVDRMVYLGDIAELSAIEADGDDIVIGAMVTHDALVRGPLRELGEIWREVAHPRIRFVGTIGGNLMAGRAHYDAMPALLALDARAEIADESGHRLCVPLEELMPAALLTAVHVNQRGWRLAADRSLHPMVSVYVAVSGTDRVRVAVGGACERAFVVGCPARDAVDAVLADLPDTRSDGLASGGYRRRMAGVLTRRTLARLGL